MSRMKFTSVRSKKRLGLTLWGVAFLAAIAYVALPSGIEPERNVIDVSNPVLADLTMAPVEDPAIGVTQDGEWFLRFSAMIVNVGDGAFVVEADRATRVTGWRVRQLVEERDEGFSARLTTSSLIWGGDGHDHWHVQEIETHWLETMDGERIGTVVKPGFCFFDTDSVLADLPGSPEHATWSSVGCGGRLDTRLRMGLSVGWGDEYAWHLFDQHIVVTGIADGRYRLRALADPDDRFVESDETNNETWTIIDISTHADGLPEIRIVEVAPLP